MKKKSTAIITKPVIVTKPAVTLSLSLKPGENVLIQVAANPGGVRGTLEISSTGVEYRWANCKKPAGRKLSWEMLTKLMQSGLL